MKAVLDVDGTIVPCNSGLKFGIDLILSGAVPKSFLIKSVFRKFYVLPLVPFSFLLPVYFFLQREGTELYLSATRVIPPENFEKVAEKTAKKIEIPLEAKNFVKKLYKSGYEIYFVSASPRILVEKIVDKIGVPSKVIALDGENAAPFHPITKGELIEREVGEVDLMVGNDGKEPFFMAKRSIVVKSPSDLSKWVGKI